MNIFEILKSKDSDNPILKGYQVKDEITHEGVADTNQPVSVNEACTVACADIHEGGFSLANVDGFGFQQQDRQRMHFKRVLQGDRLADLRSNSGEKHYTTCFDVFIAWRVIGVEFVFVLKYTASRGSPKERVVVAFNIYCDGLRFTDGAIVLLLHETVVNGSGTKYGDGCIVGDGVVAIGSGHGQ